LKGASVHIPLTAVSADIHATYVLLCMKYYGCCVSTNVTNPYCDVPGFNRISYANATLLFNHKNSDIMTIPLLNPARNSYSNVFQTSFYNLAKDTNVTISVTPVSCSFKKK